MKKAALFFCVLFSFVYPSELLGAEFYYLPQAADGSFQDGSMRTTFVLSNPSGTSVSATIRLTDDGGKLVLSGNGQTANYVSEFLPVSDGFLGSLAITSTLSVAAVTVRQNNAPVSYTTLPVADGTLLGTQ